MERFSTLSASRYRQMRDYLLAQGDGYKRDYAWAQNVSAPQCADDLVGEYVWVVLCSGMKVDIARKIQARIEHAVGAGRPVASAFGHPGKAAAIQLALGHPAEWFEEFKGLPAHDPRAVIEWCHSRPWIGPVTRYHLAKNLGADTAKPDRHIARLANLPEYPRTRIEVLYEAAMELCVPLAREEGERVGCVDLVLWWLCARGWLRRDGDMLVFSPE